MTEIAYRSQFPDIGLKFVEKMNQLGISSREGLATLGSEEVFRCYMEFHGGRKKGMCSCLAYQFEGVIRNCKRYEIPETRKRELREWVKELRKWYDKKSVG